VRGFLDSDLSPYIRLELVASGGNYEFVETHFCVVDTGFSGSLYLPENKIATWNLPFLSSIPVVLANQTEVIADAYECSVFWFDVRLQVSVLAGPPDCDSLVGMELLRGCRIELDDALKAVRIEQL
jgi:predicted aspartyl protease